MMKVFQKMPPAEVSINPVPADANRLAQNYLQIPSPLSK